MKFLLASDIHIHDFPHYDNMDGENGFRLRQFIKLAHRLVEIYKENKCECLVLAGDIIHRPLVPSNTAHTVSKFFEILNETIPQNKILYILGQHDLHSKAESQRYTDSIVHVLAPHATYVDKEIIEVNGKSIAFKNWTPNQDWSFIKESGREKVDYFIGHLCLSTLFGQEYDDSLFDLGFFGDIHQPNSIGNAHTINVPIPHNLSDCQDGSVVVLDINTGEWERILTETDEYKFLRIYYEDDPNIPGDHPYIALREAALSKMDIDLIDIKGGFNVREVIAMLVKEREYSSIHNEVSARMVESDYSPMNLNFLLRSVNIKNFRTITEFEYRPAEGITALTGLNGSGKTSLLKAIEYILNPPRSPRSLIRHGADEMKVSAVILYEGREHEIVRTSTHGGNSVEYYVNGESIEGNNTTEINNKIWENLPFLWMMDLLYREQGAPYLLSSYNYSARIKLIQDLLGLNIIEDTYKVANAYYKELEAEHRVIETNISNAESRLQSYESVDETKAGAVERIEKDLEDESSKYQEATEALRKISDHAGKTALLESNKAQQSDLESSIASIGVVDVSKHEDRISALRHEIKEANNALNSVKTAIDSQVNEIKMHRARISKIESEKLSIKDKCHACGTPFDEVSIKNARDNFDKEINELVAKVAELEVSEKTQREQLAANESMMISYVKVRDDEIAQLQLDIHKAAELDKLKVKLNKLLGDISILEDALVEAPVGDEEYWSNCQSSANTLVKQLSGDLQEAKMHREMLTKKVAVEKEIDKLRSEEEAFSANLEVVQSYVYMFHPTGEVVKSIFEEVANLMSNERFKVTTVRTLANGNDVIDFDVQYRPKTNWFDYSELSGGQKVLSDIFFLTKLFSMTSRVGMLILDETLKDMDPENLEGAAILLEESEINAIILSTHVESFNRYTTKIIASIDEFEVSSYAIEGGVM